MYPVLPLLLFLGAIGLPGIQLVSGISIYTPKELDVANGTSVRLKCTFSTDHPVTAQSVTVSWNFRALNSATEESLFYYHEVPYPPDVGRFKDHVEWSGDISRKDASITLNRVPPTFNGTYICQVRNRPDVHGSNGEIFLRVVDKVTMSEIAILALAVGVSCGAILVLLCIIVAVRFCRKKRLENDFELRPQDPEWTDPTVCSPEEAVHLTVVTKKKEVDSSDGEESEPSSGDDDDEEGGEEEDDDDDDDDDGGGDDDDDD